MKMRAYSLRDTKADSFGAPFFVPNDGIAVRLLGELVNARGGHDVSKYPADFMLYRIGSFDAETGKLEADELVSLICSASSCLAKDDPRQVLIPGTERSEERSADAATA